MRLAVSNIAWPAPLDGAALDVLAAHGCHGIEIAPTRVWPDWNIPAGAPAALRAELDARGFACSSLQAILFGQPDLHVFGDMKNRAALLEHIRRVAALAAELGAGPLVFGAPKNRDRGALSHEEAMRLAVDVFGALGEVCAQAGVCLCLEPNPVAYGCNFVTHSYEGADLVRRVGAPGFRLHLDAAGLFLSGEDPAQALPACRDVLAHVHISEPQLGGFEAPQRAHHAALAQALTEIGWNRWIAIEMRPSDAPLGALACALDFVQSCYAPLVDIPQRQQA